MHKKILITFLVSVMITSGYAQKKKNTSLWHLKEFDEAEAIPLTEYAYDKTGELFYLLSNDEQNLYIHLKASSESAQEAILMQGLTISLGTKTKGKNKLKIQYPLAMKDRMQQKKLTQKQDDNNNDQGQGQDNNRQQQGPPEFSKMKLELLNELTDIKLSGFSDDGESELIPVYSENSISAEIDFNDDGYMLYTLVIPFKDIFVQPSIKTINIALKSGKTSSSGSNSEMSGGPGGMDSGMGGGPGGMGGPGGGMGGGPGGMSGNSSSMGGSQSQDAATSISIKIKKLTITHQ
jgi:hypothetical protein